MRALVVDPAAFTLPYDHGLCHALAETGAEVELATSRFRFGHAPVPDGYRKSEVFYPLSSRLFSRSRLRVPLKVAEHPFGMIRLRPRHADVVHFQWLTLPELDRLLLPHGRPLVYTAHDLLPRRTAHKLDLWRKLLDRFHAVVVHSWNGRERLAELGIDAERMTVIPHPVFPSDPPRADDGRTLLCLGMIRPYKGLADAVEVAQQVDGSRLLVAGDPMQPVESLQAAAGPQAEWRLGYLSDAEIDRALGETTIALFPYRAELDQSGAMLRALGAGVPVVTYDVGGMAEPVRRFDAGRVVAAGDVEGMAEAVRDLLGDSEALARARAGAQAAREQLTWRASAAAHVELYSRLP